MGFEAIIFLCLVIFIVLVVLGFIMATSTIKIQRSRGYKTVFWVGFFFGPLAWLYYAAMPEEKSVERK